MHTHINTYKYADTRADRKPTAGLLHVDRQTNGGMHARWWKHTTVVDEQIVRKMDGSDGMKRHRRRERRTEVGWAGLFLTALKFPQVGLKRNRWRCKGTGSQSSHRDQCYHRQTQIQQTSHSFRRRSFNQGELFGRFPPVSKSTSLLVDLNWFAESIWLNQAEMLHYIHVTLRLVTFTDFLS